MVTKFSCLVVSNLKLDESETGVSEKKLGNFIFGISPYSTYCVDGTVDIAVRNILVCMPARYFFESDFFVRMIRRTL